MADKAISIFIDLRQWDEAKLFAASSGSTSVKELTRRQAEWTEEVNKQAFASHAPNYTDDILCADVFLALRPSCFLRCDVGQNIGKLVLPEKVY